MSTYLISDIHVKLDQRNSEILKSFLSLDFLKGDRIFFLGDIFDLMIGPHKEYRSLYSWFFDALDTLIANGVEVHYFEGNHDFHLEKLLSEHGVILHKDPVVEMFDDKRVLLCHGDEIELGNPTYKAYKYFIQSKALNFVGNYLMPYKVLNMIGENASKKSRSRNKNRYGDSQKNTNIRDSFRKAAKIARVKYDVDIVICGHSHYMDNYKWESYQYLNCGYTPNTKTYIKIADSQYTLNNLVIK